MRRKRELSSIYTSKSTRVLTSRSSAETSTIGGATMPNVRKAKPLKNYTKAQKDAYNSKQ